MNSFLYPLVQELKELWSGVIIDCPSHPLKNIPIHAALTCCACDILATRKLCGFVGHSAKLGCSKCTKVLSTLTTPGVYIGDNKRDYSGYDRENWQERNLSEHRRQAINYTQAQTKSEQKLIESEYGIRYSALLELPCFDPIRFAVVDPMHNLYLGSGKHAIQVWIDQGILTKKHFIEIEQIVSNFKTPQNIGRFPLKIASGFSGFTADQWRNWIVIFLPFALRVFFPPIT